MPLSALGIMFSAPVDDQELHHYEYRVLADGSEIVNVWEWGMMADGADMSVPEFVAEYGLEFFVSLAREDYRRWLADQGEATALSPLTISPLPTSPRYHLTRHQQRRVALQRPPLLSWRSRYWRRWRRSMGKR
jgi:hypothetical protein